MKTAHPCPLFGLTKDDALPNAELFSNARERLSAHQRNFHARKCAFVHTGEFFEHVGCDNRAQNRIAQKLKTLIRRRNRLSFHCRRMRNRSLNKLFAFKCIAENVLSKRDSFF